MDSSLTPLGMYQALSLGNKIANKKCIKNDFINNDILFGTSYQSRTQLTGLIFLKSIYSKYKQQLPKKLNHDLNLLKKISLIRFNEKMEKILEKNSIYGVYENNLKNLDEKDFKKYCKNLIKIQNGGDKKITRKSNRKSK